MNEPNVPTYSSAITHVCPCRATATWSRKEDLASVRLSMKK